MGRVVRRGRLATTLLIVLRGGRALVALRRDRERVSRRRRALIPPRTEPRRTLTAGGGLVPGALPDRRVRSRRTVRRRIGAFPERFPELVRRRPATTGFRTARSLLPTAVSALTLLHPPQRTLTHPSHRWRLRPVRHRRGMRQRRRLLCHLRLLLERRGTQVYAQDLQRLPHLPERGRPSRRHHAACRRLLLRLLRNRLHWLRLL